MRTLIAVIFAGIVAVLLVQPTIAWRRAAAERAAKEKEATALAAAIQAVRDDIRAADPATAREHCEQLRSRALPEAEAAEVDALCEWATLRVLRALAENARPNFVEAVNLVASILGGSRSGAESAAGQIAASLASRHIGMARAALAAGDFDGLRDHLALIAQLYRGDDEITHAIEGLKTDALVALTRRDYAVGDVDGVLDHAIEVAPDAPLPVQGETARLAEAAVATGLESRHAAGDVANAYEYLERAVARVAVRPELVRAIDALRVAYIGRVFGMNAVAPQRLHLSPAVGVDQHLGPDAARITITNTGAVPLTVSLRGSASENVTIPPGTERAVEVRPGRLLALVVAHGSRPAAGIATLAVAEGGAYRQVVQLELPHPPTAPARRRRPARTQA